ncbi:hypothetical protein BDY21DRAFT_339369 [Lineolata rhizophorae]|uniref:Uncharacterized protein n=1 Tax=Lineolata rhizophorae TaxID=578093 RepID=A0A6A6P568_9PEZI|nr:hypothetical protein BDY21DRAFT_339369 [Lineolata rhizophorae]
MSGFPSLQPAFTVQVEIDAPLAVGSASRNTPLNVVPMTGITVKSEPGFSPALDATHMGVGYDYIHNDPSGEQMRLDVRSQLKTKEGALLAMYYKGPVDITPALMKILGGAPDAESTPFGNSFVTFSFETGAPEYKPLENMMFVAAGRFLVQQGKPVIVEYKVSRVLKGA